MLRRSWVWIPAPYTGWIFFNYNCCKNCHDVCLRRPKINLKRGRGWRIKKPHLYIGRFRTKVKTDFLVAQEKGTYAAAQLCKGRHRIGIKFTTYIYLCQIASKYSRQAMMPLTIHKKLKYFHAEVLKCQFELFVVVVCWRRIIFQIFVDLNTWTWHICD